MKFDGRKQMFATDMEGGIGDQSKFLEEICVFVSPTISIIRIQKVEWATRTLWNERRRKDDLVTEHSVRRDFFCNL